MIIANILGHTRVLHAPQNWDGSVECLDLPILDVPTSAGNVMVSAWLPSAEELARLNEGKGILLYVFGEGHPPVMIEVQE